MSSGHIVSIPTRPYLKEYFINYYGGDDPIKATYSNKLFPFLARYLTTKPKNWKHPVNAKDLMLVELPYNEELRAEVYNYIHPRFYRPINSYLYGLFYCQFIEYMNDKVIRKRWQAKYAIYNFFDLHKIDSGNLETLAKIFYRYRHQDCKELDEDDLRALSKFREVTAQIEPQFKNCNDLF
jgi:hypothetical protein